MAKKRRMKRRKRKPEPELKKDTKEVKIQEPKEHVKKEPVKKEESIEEEEPKIEDEPELEEVSIEEPTKVEEEVKVEEPKIEGEPELEEVSIEEPTKVEDEVIEEESTNEEEPELEEVIVEEPELEPELHIKDALEDSSKEVEPIEVKVPEVTTVNAEKLEQLKEKQAELEKKEEELRVKEQEWNEKQQDNSHNDQNEEHLNVNEGEIENVDEGEKGGEVPELGEIDPQETILEQSEGTYIGETENPAEGIFGALNDTPILHKQDDVDEEELAYTYPDETNEEDTELIEFTLDEIADDVESFDYEAGLFTEDALEDALEDSVEEELEPKLTMAQRELLRQTVAVSEEDIKKEEEYKAQVAQQVTDEERLLSKISGDLSDVLPIKEGKRLESEINAKANELRKIMREKIKAEQKEQDRIDRESIELRAEFAEMTEKKKKKKKKRGASGRNKGG